MTSFENDVGGTAADGADGIPWASDWLLLVLCILEPGLARMTAHTYRSHVRQNTLSHHGLTRGFCASPTSHALCLAVPHCASGQTNGHAHEYIIGIAGLCVL